MIVRLHPHALERLSERGATEEEVRATVLEGETFAAKFGRIGFRRNFHFNSVGGIGTTRPNKSRRLPCVKGKTGL